MDVKVATCGSVAWASPGSDEALLHFSGDWTLAHFAQLEAQLRALQPPPNEIQNADFDAVTRIDTAGAGLIAVALGPKCLHWLADHNRAMPRALRALLDTVSDAVVETYTYRPPPPQQSGFTAMLERLGMATVGVWQRFLRITNFIGLTLVTFARTVPQPRRWRTTALVSHMEQAGLDAVPIVVALSFLVGAVIAFLGANTLGQGGEKLFTIQLVSNVFIREMAVMLTAILLAGRTASAFTAQIGAMKVGEELDAMRTMGLDPIELLVLPRVMALMIVTPLLTFLAMLAGVAGGLLVCWGALDITPAMFLSVFQTDTPVRYLWLGLGKAPVFGFMIALIGCLEGFSVEGNTRSMGEHTTTSVVQAIFLLIAIDTLAALFFMEMGW